MMTNEPRFGAFKDDDPVGPQARKAAPKEVSRGLTIFWGVVIVAFLVAFLGPVVVRLWAWGFGG